MDNNLTSILGMFVIPISVAAITVVLQWPSYKLAKAQLQEKRGRTASAQVEFEWLVPLWIQRIIGFILNFVATYFLFQEYSSAEPVTRASVVFVAAMMGLFVISFLLPIIMGVFKVFDSVAYDEKR